MRRGLATGFALSLLGALCLSTVLAAAGDVLVVDAAMRGDRDAVRSLLKQGADVNAAQGDGMTALHWAAMKNDVEMATMLLYAGANVKASSRLGAYTPLYLAAKNGNAAMVTALIDGGADVKAATGNGTTPLMVAAASGSAEAVKVLLDKGAEVDAKEKAKGETALMFAAAFNRVDAIKVLVEHGADLKATNTVVDLAALTSPEEEFQGRQRGQAGQAQGGGGAPAPEPSPASEPGARPAAPSGGQQAPATPPARRQQTAGVDRQYRYNELVGTQGGMTPLLFAVRQGYADSVKLLVDLGADVNQVSAADKSSPLLIATINGHFDVAEYLLEKGADPTLASSGGVTPLYAALNVQWAPKALYPQPRAYMQQQASYLDLMKDLLDKGAEPNVRLKRKVWYSGYNFDLSGVDEIGATPFWRAAYASDVEAMRLLTAYGADPNIPTMKPAGRPRTGDGGRENTDDVSGLPPIPVGGPAVTPLQAASGVGYGEGFAANSHRNAPGSWLAAVQYLVDDLGVNVNAQDHEGNTAVHHAAARGDNEMIQYLVSKGADVTKVNREGKTTADMANGPVQRTQPYPETVALLEKLGAKNNHKCVSC
jgi:ankyrin repeat protein